MPKRRILQSLLTGASDSKPLFAFKLCNQPIRHPASTPQHARHITGGLTFSPPVCGLNRRFSHSSCSPPNCPGDVVHPRLSRFIALLHRPPPHLLSRRGADRFRWKEFTERLISLRAPLRCATAAGFSATT